MKSQIAKRKAPIAVGIFLATISCLLIAAPQALAIGIEVTPSKVTITAHPGEESTIRLSVTNPSKDVALFEVYPDALESMISASPKSFTLEAGAQRYVTVAISPEKEGQYTADLSVVARPLGDQTFQAGTGVKIPLTISVETTSGLANVFQTVTTSPWTGSAVIALLVGAGAYKLGGRKKKESIAA